MIRPSCLFLLGSTALAAIGCTFAAQAQTDGTPAPPPVLPPVNVTAASPIAANESGTFVPVTVLDSTEIERGSGRTLGDILMNEPGITSSSYAPGAGRPIIRGLDAFRVRIQENGIGSQDVSALGEDHGVPIDPFAADRVEVVRGPATLRWGSQAIGGVVSVENNRIPTDATPPGISGRALGSFNSADSGLDGGASVDARHGSFAVHGDTFARSATDYRTPDGKQANSGLTSRGEAAGLSYLFGQGFVGTSISRFTSDYHIPGGEAAELRKHIDMEQIRWASRGEYRLNAAPLQALRFWLGYSDYSHDERGRDETTGIEGVNGSFFNREWEARGEAQHTSVTTPLGALNGTLGFQYGNEALSTAGEGAGLIAPAETNRYAGYLFEELSLTPALKLQAAGRVEHVTVDGFATDFPASFLPPAALTESSASRSFTPMSASIGLLANLPWDMVGRVTGQYVERAPSALELFAKGSHDASETFEIGDPRLSKEKAKTIEIGLARDSGAVRFDASAYYTRYQGFIFKRLTGVTCGEDFVDCGTPGSEFDQVVYSQRDATFYGAELKGEADLFTLAGGTFGVTGRYDFVNASFEGDGGDVPRIPPHRLGGGLAWRNDAWRAGIDLLHAFDQTRTAPLETDTDGYDLLNAQLSYTMTVNASGNSPAAVTFGISGTNLLDADIRNAASFKKDEVLLPGRSVRVYTALRF